MRSKAVIFITIILIANLYFLNNHLPAEEEGSRLLFIQEIVVNPCGAPAFEAEVKQSIPQYTEHKFPYPFLTYKGDDFHYYFLIPVKNFADIDSFLKASSEFTEKIGVEKIQARNKRLTGVIENIRYFFLQYIPGISYMPENPRLKPEERSFYNWAFFYVKFGKEKEFENILKEWLALYKSKEIPNEYSFNVGSIGTEMPLYLVVEYGKNIVDFYSEIEITNAAFGEEGKALWEKTWPLVRRFEMKQCTWRPELSYIPEE